MSEIGGESNDTAESESEVSETAGEITGENVGGEISYESEMDTAETPATLEQAQANVEDFHNQSITQILDNNGKYFSESDRERVESGVRNIRAVEYHPNAGRSGAYSTLNGKNSIEVSAMNIGQMERTTKHETNHFASKNREIIVPMPEKGGYTVHQTVGIRQTSWFHNNETGENSGFETTGRGMNEGITTMFTNEQLGELSQEKGEAAEREGVYSHATEVSKQLQDVMGKDAVAEAYYGGETMALQEKMDSIGGKGTYKAFREGMDKTISKDYAERVQGMRETQEILANLNAKKEGGQ